MRRAILTAVLAVLLASSTPAALGAPLTKQNGSTPLFKDFTPICAIAGFSSYGECGGHVTTFAGATGRINAIQAKADRYNLGFEFRGLTPSEAYTLHGNNGNWLLGLASGVSDANGRLNLSWQASGATLRNIGFDLNHNWGTTILTSYWSGQKIAVLDDTSLAPAAEYPVRDHTTMTAAELTDFYLATETIGAGSVVRFDVYTPAVTFLASGLTPGSVTYVGYIQDGGWQSLGSVLVDANGLAKATYLLTHATTYSGYFAVNNGGGGTQFIAGPVDVTTH